MVVSYPDERSGKARQESIRVDEVSKLVVEQSESVVHWFLTHADGWTLHFNEQFRGARR
jgi:hypothetical protein